MATCVLACALGGAAQAQQGAAPVRSMPPLGDAATTPLQNSPLLPSSADSNALDMTPSNAVPPQGNVIAQPTSWYSGFFVDGEYLFLKPHRDSLDYAIASPTMDNEPNGSVVSRDWNYRSAFRTGLGYRLPGQSWSVGFFYTYLHDATSGAVAAPDGGTLFATLTHPGTVSQVQTAAADTSLNYNVFDLEVGRWCALTNSFGVRLHGGGRFAQIDQNLSALYNGGDANVDQVSQRLHFNGGGFRFGADASQTLFWGLSLFGRASASLLGGNFHSTLVETNNAGATTLTNFTDRFDKVIPVTEMTLGLGWQWQNLRLTAGYQFINWFGLVNAPTFVDDAHQGKFVRQTSDLSLEGVVLRAEWWF